MPIKKADKVRCPGCLNEFLIPRRGATSLACPKCGHDANFIMLTAAEKGEFYCLDCSRSYMDCVCR